MAVTDASDTPETAEPKTKKGLKGLMMTVVAATVLGGAGFYATSSGLIDSLLDPAHGEVAHGEDAHGEVAGDAPVFVELDPLMVTVGGAGSIRQLRFRAFLQVGPVAGDAVAALQPRILDIFATYLRAVGVDRLEDPTALLQLRAQLLRRVQLLAGSEAVKDLLIIDFVIT